MSQNFVFREEDMEEEEEVFFDSRDDALSSSSSCPDSPVQNGDFEGVGSSAFLDTWMKEPESVKSRRDKFMRMMGIDFSSSSSSLVRVELDGELKLESEIVAEDDEIVVDSGAEIGNKGTENKYSISSWSSEATSTSYDGLSEENYLCSIRNLDDGTVFVVDEVSNDGTLRSLRKVGSDRTISVNDFEKNFGMSSLVLQLMRRDSSATSNTIKSVKRTKLGWLKKIGAAAWIVNRQGEMSVSSSSDSSKGGSMHAQRVRVRTYRKHWKELSAIYKGQDIKAHDGPILTMKFSTDGQYLATGGEDGVVCVWRVLECDRTEGIDIAVDDPSCIYFTVNHNSELVPLHDDQEKKSKSTAMRKSSDLSCVVIPHHVFKLSEEPVHQFHGHDGDVLDLSWSNNQCLLSSSTDKTVRLWQVGTEGCLQVFAHKNYVTGVQFNPVNENYFISGSIDGKVRIWGIHASHVVDYVDVKEIITAVCYRPDGKGAVVGTLKGNIRFYDSSENHLALEKQISFHGNKKSLMRRITGFQFCPTDSQKLMVTSADSRIRILDRGDVKSKYKGFRNPRSQTSASFTADGQHIVSASEDANVYVWNHVCDNSPLSTHVKSTWSSERFSCSNVSVAIPWHGIQSGKAIVGTSQDFNSQQNKFNGHAGVAYHSNIHLEDLHRSSTTYLSPSGSFTLRHDFFLESLPKGSATWPEEKLLSTAATSTLRKSHYKFLKNSCQNASHAWGQVIVTAGWDGRIRSYQNYGLPVHL